MGTLSTVTTKGMIPNPGKKMLYFETESTADSGDDFDASDNTVTGGETLSSIDWVVAWDQDDGDVVTATVGTGTCVVTIDSGGSTTNHTYTLVAVGDA